MNQFSLVIHYFSVFCNFGVHLDLINFSVPETMHPDPKTPEEETVEEGTVEEGAVGGGMEEQVIGEVWESQEGEEEVAVEGEGEEEESDGEGEFLS